jgi:YbgC/YbaW family acyl-CoA thioester hydrolase
LSRLTINDVINDLSKYKFITEDQVKFHEVDSFGVVHNIQYFYYLEWARTKYFEKIGMKLNRKTYTFENPIMTVHHEMDYFNPLYFTDKYEILTRVKSIKKSSFIMENILRNSEGTISVKASVTLVYLDSENRLPTQIPDEYRKSISEFEGENLIIL